MKSPGDSRQEHQIVFVDSNGTKTNGPLIVIDKKRKRTRPRRFDDASWTVDETTRRFRRYISRRDTAGLEATIRALNRLDCWSAAVRQLKPSRRLPNEEIGDALISFWITHGLSSVPMGLRANMPDLVDAFKRFLKPYSGPGLTLYRGELASRYAEGVYGIAWTPNIEVARMFAHRRVPLNEGQGVVLKLESTPEMIVASLRDFGTHTLWIGEDEYVVDPRLLRGKIAVVD